MHVFHLGWRSGSSLNENEMVVSIAAQPYLCVWQWPVSILCQFRQKLFTLRCPTSGLQVATSGHCKWPPSFLFLLLSLDPQSVFHSAQCHKCHYNHQLHCVYRLVVPERRVAKCQIFYTDKNLSSKFTPKTCNSRLIHFRNKTRCWIGLLRSSSNWFFS